MQSLIFTHFHSDVTPVTIVVIVFFPGAFRSQEATQCQSVGVPKYLQPLRATSALISYKDSSAPDMSHMCNESMKVQIEGNDCTDAESRVIIK